MHLRGGVGREGEGTGAEMFFRDLISKKLSWGWKTGVQWQLLLTRLPLWALYWGVAAVSMCLEDLQQRGA